jgi:hypothetical protein
MVLEIRLLAPEHAANHWPHQGLDQSSFDQPPLTCTNVPRVAANDVEESFREFGRRRGLFDAGGHSVEALTPLLTRAEGTALRPAVRGPLAGGGEALLGRLRPRSDSNRQWADFKNGSLDFCGDGKTTSRE